MPINKNELTKEQIAKAMSCETAEELMVLAKTEGIELTKEEAEAYLIELSDVWRVVAHAILLIKGRQGVGV